MIVNILFHIMSSADVCDEIYRYYNNRLSFSL